MATINRDSILAIKAVIGSITDSSPVEQLLPFHGKIKRLFLDLVGSPNADGIFVIHRELQCLIQVLFRWAWAYFTYARGARLIYGDSDVCNLRRFGSPKD